VNATLRLLAVAALAPLACEAAASTLVRDLGQGLSFYRVHALPADLPSTGSAHPTPCVLDLRFATSDEDGASALKAWIRFNASPQTPVFVLENSGTSAALLASLARGVPGVIVLAPESAKLGTDITVQVAPEVDRRAYDALEKGASADSLLTDYPDKPRADEAFLEKEHIPDSESPDPAADKPRPLVDVMLQRAVQLHRGLHALKRL
jgi:hypothetical protein